MFYLHFDRHVKYLATRLQKTKIKYVLKIIKHDYYCTIIKLMIYTVTINEVNKLTSN